MRRVSVSSQARNLCVGAVLEWRLEAATGGWGEVIVGRLCGCFPETVLSGADSFFGLGKSSSPAACVLQNHIPTLQIQAWLDLEMCIMNGSLIMTGS